MYDSVAFSHSAKNSSDLKSYSPVHSVLSGLVPVHDNFTITIKANKPVDDNVADKMLIKRSWKGKSEVMKATRNGDWYTAKFRSFGDFELIADDVAPTIAINFSENAMLSKARSIIITPKDENDEIKNFRAELDGKWLRFTNDKGRSFIYIFDEMCAPGNHELKVSVEDEAGNKTQKIYHFSR